MCVRRKACREYCWLCIEYDNEPPYVVRECHKAAEPEHEEHEWIDGVRKIAKSEAARRKVISLPNISRGGEGDGRVGTNCGHNASKHCLFCGDLVQYSEWIRSCRLCSGVTCSRTGQANHEEGCPVQGQGPQIGGRPDGLPEDVEGQEGMVAHRICLTCGAVDYRSTPCECDRCGRYCCSVVCSRRQQAGAAGVVPCPRAAEDAPGRAGTAAAADPGREGTVYPEQVDGPPEIRV